MLLLMSGAELRKALADIEAAERHGFMFCEAVLELATVNAYGQATVKYSDMSEKAHPSDGRYDWGRFQGVSRRHRFVDGQLVPLSEQAPDVTTNARRGSKGRHKR